MAAATTLLGALTGLWLVKAVAAEPLSDFCNDAVALVADLDNDQCIGFCQQGATADFAAACRIPVFETVNGHVQVEDECWGSWIMGYSNGERMNMEGVAADLKTESAALCQLACQQTEGCAWFQWNAVQDGNMEVGHCVLKSEEQVVGALSADVESGFVDANVCNVGTPHQCLSGAWECAECGGPATCAWKSALHVTGPRHCSLGGISLPCGALDKPTQPPAGQVTPVGELPPERVTPVGELPPERVTPVGELPPERVTPVGELPPSRVTPVGELPPSRVTPVGELPPSRVTPVGELPPSRVTPVGELPPERVTPVGELPPSRVTPIGELPPSRVTPVGEVPPSRVTPVGEVPPSRVTPVGELPPSRVTPVGELPPSRVTPVGELPPERVTPVGELPPERVTPIGELPPERVTPVGQLPTEPDAPTDHLPAVTSTIAPFESTDGSSAEIPPVEATPPKSSKSTTATIAAASAGGAAGLAAAGYAAAKGLGFLNHAAPSTSADVEVGQAGETTPADVEQHVGISNSFFV